ncbi:RNA polymerase factor sigma-54 [Fuchsiella alkaliacetigena]|uniref:RNA polymerase factor sigma-54 n=1 Tax=Fuchsiella alkaliacetigena TaxID=957042 RepID=UPI00200A0DF8|nr:RNA polymerase factor sigma-54 [Fuchsiella alkaliacetigena]MCK8824846.1 RNA polymerase factor sigma-54 [Fuchsiella alkaliacetigena]
MKLTPTVSLTQKQELVMTPKLQQAIKLLQLSRMELVDYLEDKLLENPILELEEEVAGEEDLAEEEEDFEDLDWEEYFADSSSDYNVNYQQEDYNYENFVAASLTRDEYLNNQLQLLDLTAQQKEIGKYIIGSLDEDGFLEREVAELAAELGVSEEKFLEVLKEIQQFEPVGIAAQSLQESLLIQLAEWEAGRKKELALKMVEEHFDLLIENKVKKLAKKLGIKPTESQRIVDLIKTLNPSPASIFQESGGTKYLEPDLIIEKINQQYVVFMNQTPVPKLRINSYYQKLLKNFDSSSKAKEYLEEKMSSAMWLIKSIEQRRLTIYKIAKAIVELQKEFFEKGLKHLKPLTMEEVAQEIDMHESTVSRATTKKYAQTPHGLFELKFFFTSGVKTKNGGNISAVSIKKMIEDIIKEEDVTKPLSDQKIADQLSDLGAPVSRRTVAKYRNQLGIASSVQRRRYE